MPDDAYHTGRTQVLQHLLGREQIYTTPEFGGLEIQARVNLRAALVRLAAP